MSISGPGATHFVRGDTRAAAELFGAGVPASTESAKRVTNKDGSLDACRTSSSTATAPPNE